MQIPYVSKRTNEIKNIEQDIKIINEMFKEMNEIVNHQGVILTTIEDEIGNIVITVKKAHEEIHLTDINLRRKRYLRVVSGIIAGSLTGIGIPVVLMLGIKATIIGGASGIISGAFIGKFSP